ncbi:MAG: dihydropteroate synthase, partial [Chlorobium sp.]|nr:dihydropteroate synthase [Chlorobium sp.]
MKNSTHRIQCRDRELDLTGHAKIMGILNTTPDSFFDGGALKNKNGHHEIDIAVSKALAMI